MKEDKDQENELQETTGKRGETPGSGRCRNRREREERERLTGKGNKNSRRKIS
jgi:hypothetical protein